MHRFDTLKVFIFLRVMWLLVLFKKKKIKKIHFPTTRSCLLQGSKLHNKLLSGWESGISGFLVTARPSLLNQAGCFGLDSAALGCPSLFSPHLFLFVLMAVSMHHGVCLLCSCQAREWHCSVEAGGLLSCPVLSLGFFCITRYQKPDLRWEGWWNILNARPAVHASVSEKPKAGPQQ